MPLILDVYVKSSVRNKITICHMKGTVTTDISRVQVLFAENSFVGWGISWGFSQTSLSHPKRRWWLFSRRNSFCMCGSLNEKECAHTRHYLSLKSSKKSGKSNQASMQGTSFSASQRMSVEPFSIKLSPSRLVATESKRNQSFAHMKREKKKFLTFSRSSVRSERFGQSLNSGGWFHFLCR